MLEIVQSLQSIKKFVASTYDISDEIFYPACLKTLNRQTIKLITHYSRGGLLEYADTFQKRVVGMWNCNAGDLSEIVAMGVSKFEDSTVMGTGMVNIELAKDAGLLNGGVNGCKFDLQDGYDKRKLFVFGDAASITNYNGFVKQLWKVPAASFDSTLPDAHSIRCALDRFSAFPANWHFLLNAMCQHYTRFYGSFLQPIQIVLGISRMGQDPTTTFQLSCHLNRVVHNVVERMLHDMFAPTNKFTEHIFEVPSIAQFDKMKSLEKKNVNKQSIKATILYCELFEKQLDEWITSSDEYVRLLVIFLRSCRMINMFEKVSNAETLLQLSCCISNSYLRG